MMADENTIQQPQPPKNEIPQPLKQAPAPNPQADFPPPLVAPQVPVTPKKQGSFSKGFGVGLGASVGFGVISVVLTILLVFGMIVGAIVAASSVDPKADNGLTTKVWGPDDANSTLFAVAISGAIMTDSGASAFNTGVYGYEIAKQIDALEADDYDGLVLLMDTPGGTITGSRAIHDAVARYKERTGRKVLAYVQSMSASGGMYSMAGADYIAADYGTMIGSIGVIMGPITHYKDVTATTGNILESGVITSGGITQEYFTQGKGKDFGNPFRDTTEEERANYTRGLERAYEDFVNIVSEGRGIAPEVIKNELGAYMFDERTAAEKKLIDEVLPREAAFKKAAELNNLDPESTKVVTPAAPSVLASLFGVKTRIYGHSMPLSTNEGLQATTSLCAGSPVPVAYAGSISQVCGA